MIMFEVEMKNLIKAIGDDFEEYMDKVSEDNPEYARDHIVEFREGLEVEEGDGRRKYIKIIKNSGRSRSVWGFIAKKDGKGFRAGDILKAASWNAPAMNKARGNILDGGYDIQWTGPRYL
jgi:hypothetical protein